MINCIAVFIRSYLRLLKGERCISGQKMRTTSRTWDKLYPQGNVLTITIFSRLLGRIMLGIYTMVTVILLTNLLVSIFGKTYEGDFDKTRQLWQLQRYKVQLNLVFVKRNMYLRLNNFWMFMTMLQNCVLDKQLNFYFSW